MALHHLGTRHTRTFALHHLEHVEAGGRAHRAGNATHRQGLGALDEQGRITVGRPQPQQAAAIGLLGV